jgi:hypothetical protein
MRFASFFLSAFLLASIFPIAVVAQDAGDWPTWGHDQQRSGWNQGETTLNKKNVSKMGIVWSTQVSTPPTDIVLSTLTAPVAVAGVATPQGQKNLLFLLGAELMGKSSGKRHFLIMSLRKNPPLGFAQTAPMPRPS